MRSFGRMPDPPCPLEPEILGTLLRRRLRDRALDVPEPAGCPRHGQPLPPRPGEAALPGGAFGSWTLGLGSHGPSRPAAVYRAWQSWAMWSSAWTPSAPGERAIEPGPGTYHGGLIGASLWPVGTPLIGLASQRQPASRRLPDLAFRCRSSKLAITGASGGGNQTLYAGATDDRFKAVIPVCGIGTYDAYLEYRLLRVRGQHRRRSLRHDRRPAGDGARPGHSWSSARNATPCNSAWARPPRAWRMHDSDFACSARRRRSAISPSTRATTTTSRCARRCMAGLKNG